MKSSCICTGPWQKIKSQRHCSSVRGSDMLGHSSVEAGSCVGSTCDRLWAASKCWPVTMVAESGQPISTERHILFCAGFQPSWPNGLAIITVPIWESHRREMRTDGPWANSILFLKTTLSLVQRVICAPLDALSGSQQYLMDGRRHAVIPLICQNTGSEERTFRYFNIHI